MPDFVAPQLCETVDRQPNQSGWVHEIRLDGNRVQIRVAGGNAILRTRKGLDWTHKFPVTAKVAPGLPDCIMDGDVVVVNAHGAPDFAALQAARSNRKTSDLVYFAFALLIDGRRDLPGRTVKAAAKNRRPCERSRGIRHGPAWPHFIRLQPGLSRHGVRQQL